LSVAHADGSTASTTGSQLAPSTLHSRFARGDTLAGGAASKVRTVAQPDSNAHAASSGIREAMVDLPDS
jgi:hypothetical protein